MSRPDSDNIAFVHWVIMQISKLERHERRELDDWAMHFCVYPDLICFRLATTWLMFEPKDAKEFYEKREQYRQQLEEGTVEE